MNLPKPTVIPELSHLMITDRFYHVFVVDNFHWGNITECEFGIYEVYNESLQTTFSGNAEQIAEYLWLGVGNV